MVYFFSLNRRKRQRYIPCHKRNDIFIADKRLIEEINKLWRKEIPIRQMHVRVRLRPPASGDHYSNCQQPIFGKVLRGTGQTV